jgi:PGF-CTERM protein
MLYEGPDGLSLVAVHDKYYEEKDDGTNGGSVSWTVSGLPADGEWAVIDDDYGWRNETVTKDDIFYLDEDHRSGAVGNDGEPPDDADAMLSWVWLTGRSDGVAYRGLDRDVSITIDPAFNENSYHRYGDTRRPDEEPDQPDKGERYNGTIDEWQLIVPSDNSEGFERISLDSLEEPVRIEPRSEANREHDTPTAELSVPNETGVNETVRFDATNTTGEISEYEWFVNGSQIESTDGPTTTHEFEKAGTANVTVSVVTPDGLTDTESAPIEITAVPGSDDGTVGYADELPGFGPLGALIALVVAISLAVRQTG